MVNQSRGPWEGASLDGGRYQRLTTLGAGGMGCVYRAFDGNLKTQVVIKTPRASLAGDPRYVERFEREIGALVRLSFPHIVPVIDVGRHRGAVYAVMRYLPGGSLAARVPREPDGHPRPLPPQSLRQWLPGIIKALDFIHASGYVHRDVKPANVLFDDHAQAYLSDFGIVKFVGETALDAARGTDEGTVLGSVDYMAPEILAGRAFDGRADQYALAVTIYELLSGGLPFAGDALQAVLNGHLNQIPRPLKELVPGIPRAVSDAVARALAKNPADRFATCTDFARAMKGSAPEVESGPRTETAPPTTAAPPPSPAASPPPVAQWVVPTLPQPVAHAPPLHPNIAQPYPQAPYSQAAYPQALGYPPAIAPLSPTEIPPSPEALPTALVAHAPTVPHPAAPSQRDTDRIPLPTQSPPPGPGTPPNAPGAAPAPLTARAPSRLPLIAGSAFALLLAVGAAFMIASESDPGESSGVAANSLPRRLGEWKQKADDLQSSLVVDSAPILKDAAYADAAGLESLLAEAAAGRVASASPKLEQLAVELASIADALDQRRKLAAGRQTGTSESPRDGVDRELDDLESRLLTQANQLKSLRQTAASPRGAYDSDAVAELTVLRALEAAVATDDLPTLEKGTLDRAAVLMTARNPALSFRAWNALLRAGDRRGFDAVATRFDAASLERRAELLWSLLVSARPVAIDAALTRLRRHPELADKFDPRSVPALAEKNPPLYEPVLPLLAARITDPDARFHLAVVQMRVLKESSIEEIEEACRTGPLRDRVGDLVAKIVADRLAPAYPLARRLLVEHRAVRLDALTGDEFEPLVAESPELAGLLGEAWILRGTSAQRRAALADYGSAGSPIAPSRLLDRLTREPPEAPSELINALLPRTQAPAAELAERLLADPDVLQPDRIAFATASPELLARPSAQAGLFTAAWKSEAGGRPWVMRELFGPDFVRKFSAAESERDRQLQAVGGVATVLGGRFVNKPGTSPTTAFRLPVPRREVPALPPEIETARWAPDSPARRNLADLKALAASAAERSPPAYRSTIDSFLRYLDDLDQLAVASYEIARIYDATVVQQLPGALRGLKLNTVADWEFVFPAAYVEVFRREDARYRALSASLPASRSALPWRSGEAVPADGEDPK